MSEILGFFAEFIIDEAMILVPVLWVLGMFIKRIPNVPDWTIPIVLLIIGIGLSLLLMGINPNAVIQGILVTGVAVLGHQFLKQSFYKRKGNEVASNNTVDYTNTHDIK